MIRPLITACIEYALAYRIYKEGTYKKWTFFAVLFFLASYQLGEVFIFMTHGDVWAFRFAYIATTMLPSLGVLLVEQMTQRKLGYPLFLGLTIAFVLFILTTPQIAINFGFSPFCVRVYDYNPVIATFWFPFYQGTLMYTMALMLWQSNVNKTQTELVERLQSVFIGYLSFDGVSILIQTFFPWFRPSIASLMCALALIASFIFTHIALGKKLTWTFPALQLKFAQR